MKNKQIAISAIAVSVGAVVFRGDEILLIRRGKPPFEGHWSIPGGKVEFGEALQDAIIREVHEETGVTFAISGIIDAFQSLPSINGTDSHYVMIDYFGEWVSGEPVAGDDAIAAEFVSQQEAIDRLSWDETRRAVSMAIEKRG